MSRMLFSCRQLFAGHVVGSRPIEREEKMHRMIKENIVRDDMFHDMSGD